VNTHIYSFTFIHLADAFIQSDLQLLYMSEVARLWSLFIISSVISHLTFQLTQPLLISSMICFNWPPWLVR